MITFQSEAQVQILACLTLYEVFVNTAKVTTETLLQINDDNRTIVLLKHFDSDMV